MEPSFSRVEYIDLPVGVAARTHGLAFDMGGSVTKMIYWPKEESTKEEEPKTNSGFIRLRFAWFTRAHIDEVMEFVAMNYRFASKANDNVRTVHVTGVNSRDYERIFKERFNIQLVTLTEFDCAIRAFKYLSKSIPRHQMLDKPHELGMQEGDKMALGYARTVDAMSGFTQLVLDYNKETLYRDTPPDSDETKTLAEETNLFPCMLVILGSTFGQFKIVDGDKKSECLDYTTRGGRSFLGIGKLLTGAKSFEELVELAEKGDGHNVDSYVIHERESSQRETKPEPEEDTTAYHDVVDDNILSINFGKAVSLSDGSFRKEDLARSLVVWYAVDLTQTTHLHALVSGIDHVFFAGNFGNSDVTRREITRFLRYRDVSLLRSRRIHYHFLRHGGHLPAIGCLLFNAGIN